MCSASSDDRRGGDVFEVFTRDDGSITILLADISSKGHLAELHSDALRSAFIRLSREQWIPTCILSSLNAIGFETPSKTTVTFASAIVCTIRGDGSLLSYASAGHDLAMILGERLHRHLKVTGPLLGVFPDPVFGLRTEPLETSDFIVCVTDGVTECRNAYAKSLRFGTSGLVRALTSVRLDGPRMACDAVVRSLDEFGNRHYGDEATIAVVARR
jgi:serine phosphatase RsbU (regulator of sigma subunit)